MAGSGSTALDLLVVTAADRAQAAGFREELAGRESVASAARAWEVIADPEGGRVGSGGASLLALERIVGRLGGLSGRRVLLLHCGGESRRLPAYAPTGKVFVPLPVAGDRTLFDLVLADMMGLRWPEAGGAIVGAGDVFFGLAADSLEMAPRGITGVGVPAPVEIASGHGVFVLGGGGEVARFLQKPTREDLAAAGALDGDGTALADSGVVSLTPEAVSAWLARAAPMMGAFRRAEGRLDLYADMLTSIGGADGWPAPGGFHGLAARSASFIHLGSTRALFEAFVRDAGVRARLGVVDRCASIVAEATGPGRLVCRGSTLEGSCGVEGGGAYVEGCRLVGEVRLGGENVLVGVGGTDMDFDVPRGVCVACFPVDGGAVAAMAFGIDDDFKTPSGRGGTLAHRPLASLGEHSMAEIWSAGEEEDLWHARLWRVADATTALADALALARGERVDAAAERVSAAEVVRRVDRGRLAAWRAGARAALG
jgi:fucokinase